MHIEYELAITDLPAECVADCSASGPVDESVAYWREKLAFTVDRTAATRCLKGYGAWTAEELAACSDQEIADKILWLACGNFSEWDGTPASPCGSDVFTLD